MKNKIKINKNLIISENSRPLIVAEISANHCGNKKKIFDHIRSAKSNGADLIKIQAYEEDDISIDLKDTKYYKNFLTPNGESLFSIYKKSKTPYIWLKDIFDFAKKLNITLFSSVFSLKGIKVLEKLNNPIYKISSFEITDHQLLTEVAKTNKPIIISTGMSKHKEVMHAVKLINKYHNKLIILHCVSGYPTPIKYANISEISKLKKKFKKNYIGLSDHTDTIFSSLSASALGAKIIEKHFLMNKKLKSYDKDFSILPNDLKNLKENIFKIHESLGNLNKKIKFDSSNIKFRRSIYAKRDIKINQKISLKDLVTLRPKIGMCASKIYKIVGLKAKKRIKKNSPIFLNVLKS